jgi:hypothetical protein
MLEYMGMLMAELHSSDSASPAQAHIITNWSLIDAVSGNAQVYGHGYGCAALLKFSLTSTSTCSTLSDTQYYSLILHQAIKIKPNINYKLCEGTLG